MAPTRKSPDGGREKEIESDNEETVDELKSLETVDDSGQETSQTEVISASAVSLLILSVEMLIGLVALVCFLFAGVVQSSSVSTTLINGGMMMGVVMMFFHVLREMVVEMKSL